MTPKKQRSTTLSGITAAQIDRLQEQSKTLGYVTKVGGGRGNGSISARMRAEADGELTVLRTEDYNALVQACETMYNLLQAGEGTWTIEAQHQAAAAIAKAREDAE